jgi:hypothetical protein
MSARLKKIKLADSQQALLQQIVTAKIPANRCGAFFISQFPIRAWQLAGARIVGHQALAFF